MEPGVSSGIPAAFRSMDLSNLGALSMVNTTVFQWLKQFACAEEQTPHPRPLSPEAAARGVRRKHPQAFLRESEASEIYPPMGGSLGAQRRRGEGLFEPPLARHLRDFPSPKPRTSVSTLPREGGEEQTPHPRPLSPEAGARGVRGIHPRPLSLESAARGVVGFLLAGMLVLGLGELGMGQTALPGFPSSAGSVGDGGVGTVPSIDGMPVTNANANLPGSPASGNPTAGPAASPTALPNRPGAANAPDSGLQVRRTGGTPDLPSDAGQYWKTYDLRPYTKGLKTVDRPQQAVVDWVLRETGTDVWFTEPFGFLNADRETLRVYHNEQMHQVVSGVYEQFVNGTSEPQLYGLKLLAIGNPNWRTRAQALMTSVKAQSPGVHAYLLSKENSAMLMAMLRGRTDYTELSSVDMVVHNGQAQVLEQVRGRNFIEDFQPVQNAWPPYMPTTGEIQEGYRLQLSPLLSVDQQTVDLVVKCNIDQVERLANVTLDLPLQNGQTFTGQINVPQVASWRLHERFRWPANQVLLLSCGVVAAPQGTPNSSLLGRGTSLIGLDKVLAPGRGRADALLVIEYRGSATGRVPSGAAAPNSVAQPTSPLSRGRY